MIAFSTVTFLDSICCAVQCCNSVKKETSFLQKAIDLIDCLNFLFSQLAKCGVINLVFVSLEVFLIREEG